MRTKQGIVDGLIDYCDRNGLEIDYYQGNNEPGYDDQPFFAADWNPKSMQRIGVLLEKIGYDIEWSDEWAVCDDCYKGIRTSPDSYGWEPSFIMGDGYLVCHECAIENLEDYIVNFTNDKRRAIHSWMIEPVKAIGFRCWDDCKLFESGWHPGQTDTPESALTEIYEQCGKEWFENRFDYLFAITDTGQFDIRWTMLIRDKAI